MFSEHEIRENVNQELEAEYERQMSEIWTPTPRGIVYPVEDIFAPTSFAEYIGQEDAKALAQITLQAAKKDGRALPNMLIVGEYGLGKTSLARLIMQDYGEPVRLVDGASVNAALPSDHVILDEIHNLNPEVADSLNILIDSNKVHIIGCTTDPGALPSAFRSRFRVLQLESYDVENLTEILNRVVRRKHVSATKAVLSQIALRSRFNARYALSNLSLVFDLLTINSQSTITSSLVKEAFKKLGVDSKGFLRRDYKFMAALSDRPVGLQYLQAATGLDAKTIEEEVEPYLMKMGLLDRTPRGRLKLKDIEE